MPAITYGKILPFHEGEANGQVRKNIFHSSHKFTYKCGIIQPIIQAFPSPNSLIKIIKRANPSYYAIE
jgi:hypothetical protein